MFYSARIGKRIRRFKKHSSEGLGEAGDDKKKRTPEYIERNEQERGEFVKKLENVPKEKLVYVDEKGIANKEVARRPFQPKHFQEMNEMEHHRAPLKEEIRKRIHKYLHQKESSIFEKA